ncbi:MAG TPA: DUF6600 domain-containing protein [Burkholderiaceae bacterium]|nr:DUF6600 domain-containing protein [Burkholderiaceae bacterium]
MKTLLSIVLTVVSTLALAADPAPPPPGADTTPPRLSFTDGKVSFWRPGAEDWAPARVNTPLAAGDALYTGERANVEIQVGPRAFVRAGEKTNLGIVAVEPDFLQVKLTSGHASVDLRSLPAGYTVELDTPNAVFTIEHPGYYRAGVGDNEVTRFVTRRGGRATITLAEGPAQAIAPSEEVLVRGTAAPVVETYVAPELDAWDRWNYARTDHEIEALSARYVSPGVYGVGVLDQWGTWRVVPTYGAVWVPDRVAVGWAPYTTGSWIWDPFYGWTWVDDAPWGWAPFHYGRWVFIGGVWAWAPGPVIVRPVYAPALVAFFGVDAGVSVRIGIAGPAVGWVVLGWGEPLRPWWGPPGFIGVPWWGGWGGPRIVNNVVIERTTVVNVNTIVYHHTKTPRGVVAVGEKHFGAGPIRGTRFTPGDPHELKHFADALPVRPGAVSLVPARSSAIRPPVAVASRGVVATRPPREAPGPHVDKPKVETPKPAITAPAPRIVVPPKAPDASAALPRPSFGEKGAERARPPQPPRLEDLRRAPPPVAQRPPQPTAPPAQAMPGRTPRIAPPAVGPVRQERDAHVQRTPPGKAASREAEKTDKASGRKGAEQR